MVWPGLLKELKSANSSWDDTTQKLVAQKNIGRIAVHSPGDIWVLYQLDSTGQLLHDVNAAAYWNLSAETFSKFTKELQDALAAPPKGSTRAAGSSGLSLAPK